MILKGSLGEYTLGTKVGGNKQFSIYLCKPDDDSGRDYVLVVAKDGMNGIVDRWGFVLKELMQHAKRLEDEYASVKTDANEFLNYQLGFPILMETFNSPEKRKILILRFENSEPENMVPIARMIEKDNLRVDMKTSVWMMGKVLKLLSFVHRQKVSVGPINTAKVLIDPDEHYVNFFDLSAAQITHGLTKEAKKQEIIKATSVVLEALQGDVSNRTIPNSEGKEGERYSAFLWQLFDGKFSDASVAHKRFYEFVNKLWERKFYPFTTYKRN